MTSNRTPHPTAAFLIRYSVECLAALTLLFILQAGLVPFGLAIEDAGGGGRLSFDTKVSDTTFPDLVGNIFLYVPFGALLHASLCRMLPKAIPAWLTTVALCLSLSGGIEWLQAYSDTRVSSLVDVVANGVGAVLGASLSWVARRMVPVIVGAAVHEFHERPASALVKSYCALLVVFAALPFSFSLDTTRLKEAVKAAVFVPFGASLAETLTLEALPEEAHTRAVAHLQWQRMKRWSRWAAEGASFVVLVWLLRHLLRRVYGFNRRATTALVWWLCGLFALTLSLIQFPVVGRGLDVTDVLFRLIGVAGGLLTLPAGMGRAGAEPLGVPANRWRGATRVGCAATAAYIVYTGVIPATFANGGERPTAHPLAKHHGSLTRQVRPAFRAATAFVAREVVVAPRTMRHRSAPPAIAADQPGHVDPNNQPDDRENEHESNARRVSYGSLPGRRAPWRGHLWQGTPRTPRPLYRITGRAAPDPGNRAKSMPRRSGTRCPPGARPLRVADVATGSFPLAAGA